MKLDTRHYAVYIDYCDIGVCYSIASIIVIIIMALHCMNVQLSCVINERDMYRYIYIGLHMPRKSGE